MSLKRRMILSMLSVVVISGGISSAIGGYLLWRQLNLQARNRVRQDLNAAREFYRHRLAALGDVLQYTAMGESFAHAVAGRDLPYITRRLKDVRASVGLDMLCVTDAGGTVIHRAHRPDLSGDSLADLPMVRQALNGAEVVSGTLLYPLDALERESPLLAKRARIPVLPTPPRRARPRPGNWSRA